MNKRNRLVGLASAGLVMVGSAAAQVPATSPAPAVPMVQATAPAASTATPKKTIFTKKTSFRLPVQIKDPRERARLQQVQLYVKVGANGIWTINQKANPDADHFDYLVPQDGEYWFRLVTVDNTGHMNPPDVSRSEPSLIVVVDTKAPECDVKALLGQPGELVLQCDARDDNLDPTKTKLEYQVGERGWQPFTPHATMANCYPVPDLSVLKSPVRVTACDRAGNQCVREFTVTPQNTAITTPAPVAAPSPITQAMAGATPVPGSESVSEKPGDDKIATLVVKSKRVPLEYSTDGNLAGRLVVWGTADGGQTWQQLCEDKDHTSPVEVNLPGEGRYGICMIPCTEAECKPPAKGEAPQCWVEVDTVQPTAAILAVRPGDKEEAGTILVTWTASDKNLKAEPIDLYYATQPKGPFLPIAKGIKNDGNYRWHYPAALASGDKPTDIFIRMEVTDKAGNMTRCDGVQPPSETSSKPKVKFIGVANPN